MMMDLFRMPSVKRKRRRESIVSSSPSPFRTSTSLPDLVNLNQPFFIPDEDFNLAQLRAKSRFARAPTETSHLQVGRPDQYRSVSTPIKTSLPDKEETVLGSPFETVKRPLSTTSRRSSTFSNTTTGPTPDFFAHQKARRSFTSVRTAATTYTLSEAHKAEMNKLRKDLPGRKRSEPLEGDPGYAYPEGHVGPGRYHPLAIGDMSLDMDIGLNESESGFLSKPVSLRPVFHEGYQLSRDFRVSPSAEVLTDRNGKEASPVHHASPLGSPISEAATSSEESGARRSILDRPRKSMIFNVAKDQWICGKSSFPDGLGGAILPANGSGKIEVGPEVILKGRKGRELFGLNIVVAGAPGVGKSSLANTIFTVHSHPHLAIHLPGLMVDEDFSMGSAPVSTEIKTCTDSFPVTSYGTRSFCKKTVVLTVEAPSASTSTKRFSRHPAKPAQSLHPITIIDTPGLPESTSDDWDQAVRGLERLIEDRMAEKLRQERSIRRLTRKGGLETDGLVHLVLYMIDPLSILTAFRSDSALPTFDYESVDRPTAPLESKATDAWKPQLRQNDVSAILRLSRRTTVLPIIGRADILTTAQRDAVKHVVWRDLLAAGLADNFSILEHFCQGPAESESLEVQTQKQGQQDTGFDHDYMKRSSDFDLDLLSTRLLLFCVNPEQKAYSSGETGKIQKQEASSFIRRYVWGGMDILDSKFGDTGRLYSGLLSQALATALATKTAEDFYEDYRSEQLALHQD